LQTPELRENARSSPATCSHPTRVVAAARDARERLRAAPSRDMRARLRTFRVACREADVGATIESLENTMSLRSNSCALACVVSCGAAALVALTNLSNTASAQRTEAGTSPTWAPNGKRERLTPENCVFAFIDHQTGLMNLVDNAKPVEFKNIVIGLAKTAKIHQVPTVITTSAETGPNGPFLPEVLALLPDAPVISRPGQINAWDNADFVEAIRKTGRRKIVMSGITTDVCVAFAALSAIDAGYEVYVVVDASGCQNADVQMASLMRMSNAGATMGTWFALSCELLSDWRHKTGAESAKLFIDHMPAYAEVYHSHKAQTQSSAQSPE
jgi:nicotinamidase-related amidase